MHLSYVRERTGHALIGARQWIPGEHISDPVCSLVMGLPDDLVFRTKGELAIEICTDAFADGAAFDFVCGDEVYGACTKLREFLEGRHQAYVLRVPRSFALTLARGVTLTCADVTTRPGDHPPAHRSAHRDRPRRTLARLAAPPPSPRPLIPPAHPPRPRHAITLVI